MLRVQDFLIRQTSQLDTPHSKRPCNKRQEGVLRREWPEGVIGGSWDRSSDFSLQKSVFRLM